MNKVQVESYYDLIKECFSSDPELISTWHIEAGTSVDNCTIKTCKDLEEAEVTVYALQKDNKVVGYFGIEKLEWLHCMTGFFIKPEYRTKEVVKEFWSVVDNSFEDDYYVGLYKKNTPAVAFLRRRTPTIIDVDEESIFFVVNKESTCH